jgi:peptide/nickel transport system permease protein
MKLWAYLLRRLFLIIPTLIGVTVITFTISHLIPGDPIAVSLGPYASQEQIQLLRMKRGLDRPVHIQYLIYLRNLSRGDLGTSIHSQRAVLDDLKDFFPATFELTTASMLISILLGIPLGIIAAVKKNRWPDFVARLYALVGVSMPVFWLGLLLLLLFYFKLGWLPGVGRLDPRLSPPTSITGLYLLDSMITLNWKVFFDALKHILLPAFSLSCVIMATISRMTRATMLEVMTENYIRAARAKGLSERIVIYRHALKNALIPVVTIIGIMYGVCLAGSVLTESIFSWPGIGRYAVKAITFLDLDPIMGFTLVSTFIYVFLNLMVDVAYMIIDPRIKY